ncbi:hypothetical protein AB670_01558 [Chryseobacterium sp. MOF25P]|nr:hypothetical protein AB670_01558 [Chryseobacterium sp. MOF25P]
MVFVGENFIKKSSYQISSPLIASNFNSAHPELEIVILDSL